MKKFCLRITFLITSCIFISGCTYNKVYQEEVPQTVTPIQPIQTPEEEDGLENLKTEIENTVYSPKSVLEITDVFASAIPVFAQHIVFDLSSMEIGKDEQKQTVQNAYYEILANNPSFKYAYEIAIEKESPSTIKCTIQYMPYKLGTIDENTLLAGTYVIHTLQDLIQAAQETIGKESAPIAILNPELEVEDMQRSLMQAGYGYIVFLLNNDATEIKAMPTNGRTMEECVQYINKTSEIADGIIKNIIQEDMTADEKLSAIYNYVTSNVVYDQRYYGAPQTMPYESTTAYGALQDNLAICGGYSWAVKTLAEKVGIECYNVSGNALGESHIWSIVKYKDTYSYFDATFDRGRNGEFNYFAKKAEDLKVDHTWAEEDINKLILMNKGEQ